MNCIGDRSFGTCEGLVPYRLARSASAYDWDQSAALDFRSLVEIPGDAARWRRTSYLVSGEWCAYWFRANACAEADDMIAVGAVSRANPLATERGLPKWPMHGLLRPAWLAVVEAVAVSLPGWRVFRKIFASDSALLASGGIRPPITKIFIAIPHSGQTTARSRCRRLSRGLRRQPDSVRAKPPQATDKSRCSRAHSQPGTEEGASPARSGSNAASAACSPSARYASNCDSLKSC